MNERIYVKSAEEIKRVFTQYAVSTLLMKSKIDNMSELITRNPHAIVWIETINERVYYKELMIDEILLSSIEDIEHTCTSFKLSNLVKHDAIQALENGYILSYDINYNKIYKC